VGIWIEGEPGAFVTVRQSSLSGFAVGVRVLSSGPMHTDPMWLVAETRAEGASTTLDAPDVEQIRNYP
jgi:hypothetical protein